jgi:hypothetical protein
MFKTNKEIQNYLSSKILGKEVIETLYLKDQGKIENELFPEDYSSQKADPIEEPPFVGQTCLILLN